MTAITTTVHHDAFTEVDGDLVQVVREDYADPAEQSGIMLSVKCTTVVLTLAEAIEIAAALRAAAVAPQAITAKPAEAPRVVDLMAQLEASLERAKQAKAEAAARRKRTPCPTCDGNGAVRAYGPIDDHAICPDCSGTGRAA